MNLWDHTHLTLERLRLLQEVSRHGSIAAVARQRKKNPNRISTSLKELGQVFAVELVRRKGRGIVLTPAGMDLARRAADISQSLLDYDSANRGSPKMISLGAGDAVLQFLVIPRASVLLAHNVQLILRNLRTQELVSALLDRHLDFAVIHDLPRQKTPAILASADLGQMKFSVFVPKGLERKSELGNAAWPELAGLPLALQSETGSFRRRLDHEVVGHGSLNVHLECESFPMAAQAVRIGAFAAILPDLAASFLPAGTTKKLSFLPLKRCAYDLTLLWHKRTEALRSDILRAGQQSFQSIATRLRDTLLLG